MTKETCRDREGERLKSGMKVRDGWKEGSLPTLQGHNNLCRISERIGNAGREMDLIFIKCFS